MEHLVLPDHPVDGLAVRGAVLGGRAAVAVGRAALTGIRADGVADLTASASPGRHGAFPRGRVDTLRMQGNDVTKIPRILCFQGKGREEGRHRRFLGISSIGESNDSARSRRFSDLHPKESIEKTLTKKGSCSTIDSLMFNFVLPHGVFFFFRRRTKTKNNWSSVRQCSM